MNKILIPLLILILLTLQYKLWIRPDGIAQMQQLKQTIAQQQKQNLQLRATNLALEAEVRDLKQGKQAVAERARSELGMIQKNEVFYQIVP